MCTFEDVWDLQNIKNLETPSYNSFECKVINRIINQLDDCFKFHKNLYNGTVAQNDDDKLRNLVEINKDLRLQIDSILESLSGKQTQYETFKKDQKCLSQEIKETHEAFLMAKKYYKKFLKIYHNIESRNGEKQTIFMQFFTESKKDSENYSVRLLRNTKNGHYQLMSTTPNLSNIKEFQTKLQETNDVPGALCNIRQIFLSMKLNKKT